VKSGPPSSVPPSKWPAGKLTATTRPVNILGLDTSRIYVLFLMDFTGSMLDAGDEVRNAVTRAVKGLAGEQYFEVIVFRGRSMPTAFRGNLRPATPDNKQHAVDFLRSVQPHGQTDPIRPLRSAHAALAPANGSQSQMIFLLTDGGFPDNAKFLRAVDALQRQAAIPIYPVIPHAAAGAGHAAQASGGVVAPVAQKPAGCARPGSAIGPFGPRTLPEAGPRIIIAGPTMSDQGAPQLDTPAMRQYRSFKDQYPEYILMFRMGDFYEMFYEDAKIASRVLGLALTSRSKGPSAVPLAGIPYHALDSYLAKLVRAGHRVAICEQVEDASKAKGLVKRDITRLVTPGTLTEENLLDQR
ncbi:hypothetical protein LCGC14_3058720, partial [marine sediment metagenome]